MPVSMCMIDVATLCQSKDLTIFLRNPNGIPLKDRLLEGNQSSPSMARIGYCQLNSELPSKHVCIMHTFSHHGLILSPRMYSPLVVVVVEGCFVAKSHLNDVILMAIVNSSHKLTELLVQSWRISDRVPTVNWTKNPIDRRSIVFCCLWDSNSWCHKIKRIACHLIVLIE